MTAAVVRAVLYSRVSTPEQNVGMQLDELRRVASQRGWSIVEELNDVGSGARSDLPARARAIELARLGRVDVVAVWRLDRLGRSVRDLVDAVEALRAANVELVSLRDAIDTTSPAGRLVFHVLAAVAELEREIIRERVVAGLERARRTGTQLGRPRRAVDLGAAREMLVRGASVRAAARRLGIPPRTLRRALAGQKPAAAEVGQVPETAEPETRSAGRGTR